MDAGGRHGGGDHPAPAVGLVGHGGVGGDGAPVVADDDGVLAGAQGVVQCVGIPGQGANLVVAVGRNLGRAVAAEERGHGVVAGGGQLGQEVAPGVGRVGKPVETQGQGTVRGPSSK